MENENLPPGAEGVIQQDPPPDQIQQQNPPSQEAQPAAPQAPAWDPKEYGYVYKGQTYYPQDKNQLKQLMERGHAHAQRIGELNREWESKLTDYEKRFAPYQQLEQLFQQNPDFQKRVMELQQQFSQQAASGNVDPAVSAKLEQVEEWMRVSQEREADQRLESSKKAIQDKYKDYDWNTVDGEGQTLMHRTMRHALENNIMDLEKAFHDLMWDEHAARAESKGRQAAAQGVQQAHKQGFVASGGSIPRAPQKIDPTRMTPQQVEAAALAMLNAKG